MEKNTQPINNIQWINVDELIANDYNPNVVLRDEMKLLKFSIEMNGWIQPILITQKKVIIDGFHRATIAKTHKEICVDNCVPCVMLTMSEPERMMLTIRINRAKGTHIALKMSDIVHRLVNEYDISIEKICQGIGAKKDEVELLLLDNVFEKKNINEQTEYSKAWYPKQLK